jgi:TIR domain-containing protein
MDVFISWSGPQSRRYADAINSWIPLVIQAVRPYFTPDDIEKGVNWSTNISEKLKSSKFGIFCLTRENLNSPWLHFEAGAISKIHDDSAVCSILFGLESSDVTGPLNQFQMTSFDKDEMLKLVKSLNNSSDSALTEKVVEESFKKWWPDLEAKIKQISVSEESVAQTKTRDQKDMVEEILSLTRMLVKQEKNKKVITQEKFEIPGLASGDLNKRITYPYEISLSKSDLNKMRNLTDVGVSPELAYSILTHVTKKDIERSKTDDEVSETSKDIEKIKRCKNQGR